MRWASREPHERPSGRRASEDTRKRHGALHRIYRGETKIDFIGKRKVWFLISSVVLLACIAIIAFQGLTLGIEFEGGIQIPGPRSRGRLGDASNSDVVTEVRSALEGEGADDAQIQVFTSDAGRGLTVQSKEIADPESQERAVDIVSETVGAPISDIGSQRIEASGEARSPRPPFAH